MLRTRIVESLVHGASKEGFREDTDARLLERIQMSKQRLSEVQISEVYQNLISQICAELEIDGLRGDLVLTRASRAFAAWSNRSSVLLKDIRTVLPFCLTHRLRKDPLDTIDTDTRISEVLSRLSANSS
jgi:magnesium chelatase subunit I